MPGTSPPSVPNVGGTVQNTSPRPVDPPPRLAAELAAEVDLPGDRGAHERVLEGVVDVDEIRGLRPRTCGARRPTSAVRCTPCYNEDRDRGAQLGLPGLQNRAFIVKVNRFFRF